MQALLHESASQISHTGTHVASQPICKLQERGQRSRIEQDLKAVFDRVAHRDKEDEADGAYTCTLTMEPFRDPVMTKEGNSYERAALLEHLKKVRRRIYCLLSYSIIYIWCWLTLCARPRFHDCTVTVPDVLLVTATTHPHLTCVDGA